MSNTNLLRSWLKRGVPILADGAMGTMLHSGGVSLGACFDELNLTSPKSVAEVHRAYVRAGAQIIETNTFGANRYKLSQHGLEDRVDEVNAAGVRLAQEVVASEGAEVLIAGSVGPLGVRLAPFGRVKAEEAFGAFREQIQALARSGVDLIMLETHSDLYEVEEAIRATQSVTDLPIIASMTFTRDDRTLLGDEPARVARKLIQSGVEIIGANCSSGPAQLLDIIDQMQRAAPEAKLSVMPNAGWPERVAGRIMYPADPEYFGAYAVAFSRAGAAIIGGCCGTTPEHIAAMRAALDDPDRHLSHDSTFVTVPRAPEPSLAKHEPTQLAQLLKQKRFVISVEVNPPRGFSTHKLMAGAHLLAEARADVINVADSPMARMRMSPWAVCELLQRKVGIETVLHFPTRGRNLLRIQGDLLAAHALGVRNVFVVMGDPTDVGDYPEAMDNYDLVPTGLIRLIKYGFNTGVDHAGSDIGGATSFFVGCALNLCAKDVEREIRLLHKKIEAGADFALTQPVYETEPAQAFLDAYAQRFGKIQIPLLVGLLPLYGERHAAFLHNEVPGIKIPENIRRRIATVADPCPEEGVRIAVELLGQLKEVAQGAYLMPPFSRYDMAAEIIEATTEKVPVSDRERA